MKNRYKNCFANLKDKNEGAFVPFVMLADPDLELSYKIIATLVENGADALELGIPFSDPIADGPVIQAAALRALKNNATVSQCFALIESVRRDFPDIPIGLLVYSNLVVGNGIDKFYEKAASSGVDSVLVADVPTLESELFTKAAQTFGIDPIFIATPNADEATIAKISSLSKGYTYLLSRAGVTGTETQAEMPVERIINALKANNAPPSLLGFGISNPEQVKNAIAAGADGAISGSAIVKIIENAVTNTNLPINEEKLLTDLGSFVAELKAATHK